MIPPDGRMVKTFGSTYKVLAKEVLGGARSSIFRFVPTEMIMRAGVVLCEQPYPESV